MKLHAAPVAAPRETARDAGSGSQQEDLPTKSQQTFCSLFTPTWACGLFLFLCFFLPSYQGCKGRVVYPCHDALHHLEKAEDWSSSYSVFLLTWPYAFGLVVAVGTIWLACGRCGNRASLLWYAFAALIVVNATLLLGTVLESLAEYNPQPGESSSINLTDALWISLWIAVNVALPVSLVVTRRYCRSWYNRAMWMQIILSLLTAVWVALFLPPAYALSSTLLIGGQIAVICTTLLVITSVIQRIDGFRVLTRKRHESPLRLSLKTMLLLMPLGCAACCWISTILVAPYIATAEQQDDQNAVESGGNS